MKSWLALCIAALLALLGGCAVAPAATEVKDAFAICEEVLVFKEGAEGAPTTQRLAEYLRGLLVDRLPESDRNLWFSGLEFVIDGERYTYCRGDTGGYVLVSENAEAYGLSGKEEVASLIPCYREGRLYYDLSLEGYLLQAAALTPTKERDGLRAELYLNNGFFLKINDRTIEVGEHGMTGGLFHEEDQYWNYATKLHVIETEDPKEQIVLCAVGWSTNGYGYINDWGLYRYGDAGIEMMQYAPGEFEKLQMVAEKRGEEVWWTLPAYGFEQKAKIEWFSNNAGGMAAFDELVRNGDIAGQGKIEPDAIGVLYSYEYIWAFPDVLVITHPISTAADYYVDEVRVFSRVTAKGLEVLHVEKGMEDNVLMGMGKKEGGTGW